MSWKEALAEYATMKGQYIIPKKGTKEYDEVKAIQEKIKTGGGCCVPVQEPKTNKSVKKGKGVKEVFVNVIKRVNNAIDNNIEGVPEDVPLAPGEMHAKKLVRRDGKIKRQNYNFAGPGTNVERRLAQNIQPIDGIDAAAKQHDIDYTLDFQNRMKRGNKVSKQEVQAADKRFVEKVKQSRGDNPVFAALIPPVFKAKEIAENTGVLSHTAFFDPAKTGGSVMSDFKIKSMSKRKY